MITTPDLISTLANNLAPVQRLRPPMLRAISWLLLAAVVFALVAMSHGVRADLAARFTDSSFVLELAGALLTGLLSVVAAFFLSLPDRSRWWMVLPLPTFLLWMSTLGQQCLTNWVAIGPNGMTLGESAECFATFGLVSLPLSLALMIMLRHVKALRATEVVVLGGLAVAGVAAAALSLLHEIDATAMILVFNLGVALFMIGAGAVLGILLPIRRLF